VSKPATLNAKPVAHQFQHDGERGVFQFSHPLQIKGRRSIATGQSRMKKPVIVPLGGFLGAGKTTLVVSAAQVLQSLGKRAAAVLNDQGVELVDTRLVQQHDIVADQVTGGCFCCRFSDLAGALERLHDYKPDVIFAEAVGSCTDISATTLQPLKRDYRDQFRLAPFSVLVDPRRARELMEPDADPDLAFLFRNQVAEADLVCFTKSDLYQDASSLPGADVRSLSAKTGQGVAEWLDEVLTGELAGGKLLDIDYGRYAQAEAALSWLNCRATVRLRAPLSPAMVVGPLLDRIRTAMIAAGFRIAHLKLIDDCVTGYIKASTCANDEEPSVEGTLAASPATFHELLLNIRAVAEPYELRRIVQVELDNSPRDVDIKSFQCFRPAAPKPEQRLGMVI
jgi:CobW/HypB/UreG, nucleotide-binding domain